MTEPADPYPQRTPCPFVGCPTSAEEHHRVNVGLVVENGELRRKLRFPDQGADQPTDHRAEAERWLAQFLESIGLVTPTREDMLRLAHIHALLAGLFVRPAQHGTVTPPLSVSEG